MLKKIPYQAASQILPRFTTSAEASELIDAETSTEEAIALLGEHELYNDLMQFFAHALPPRECIWWAACCVARRKSVWNPQQIAALDTVEQWVKSPSEELRRKAELFANRLDLNCGPSWLAQAVFWNGSGSIVAPDLPVVMPDPFLYAKAAAGAVNHAAALPEWDQSQDYYKAATELALNIAKGGNGVSL